MTNNLEYVLKNFISLLFSVFNAHRLQTLGGGKAAFTEIQRKIQKKMLRFHKHYLKI